LQAVVHYENVGTGLYCSPGRSSTIARDPCRRDISQQEWLVSHVACIVVIFVDTNRPC
jgi:hypothetical protein